MCVGGWAKSMHNALNLLSSVCSPLFVITLYTEMRENKTLLLTFLCTNPLSRLNLTYARPLNINIFIISLPSKPMWRKRCFFQHERRTAFRLRNPYIGDRKGTIRNNKIIDNHANHVYTRSNPHYGLF